MTPDLRPLDKPSVSLRPPFDERSNRRDFRAALVEAIGPDVELGAHDERIITWLAGWDLSIVGTVASLLYRVRAAGARGVSAETEEEP